MKFVGKLDEKDVRHYDLDCDHHQDYPYLKTNSGILQKRGCMPWDYQQKQYYWALAGVTSTLISGLLRMI